MWLVLMTGTVAMKYTLLVLLTREYCDLCIYNTTHYDVTADAVNWLKDEIYFSAQYDKTM
jgi:hypothetical protein